MCLAEFIVLEIKFRKNSIIFTCNYRSLSQAAAEFDNHCKYFHLTLSNINDTSRFCTIVTGDFIGRCSNYWAGDVSSNTGTELDSLV